jgi:hypothetical protein
MIKVVAGISITRLQSGQWKIRREIARCQSLYMTGILVCRSISKVLATVSLERKNSDAVL